MTTKPTITSILRNELNDTDLVGLSVDELHDLIEAFAGMSSFLYSYSMSPDLINRIEKVEYARRAAEIALGRLVGPECLCFDSYFTWCEMCRCQTEAGIEADREAADYMATERDKWAMYNEV